jgi:hypothetical protein
MTIICIFKWRSWSLHSLNVFSTIFQGKNVEYMAILCHILHNQEQILRQCACGGVIRLFFFKTRSNLLVRVNNILTCTFFP